ncbi:hypothetical protein Cgig2_033893 [Carnegiea gigantea]|uniref:IP5PC-F beta-propeller domain-containing protein n=1 Tax=Carnegiea gigantea TaxID=171969 RepID=A0A9Q1GVH3_9CARY|nr:hypothetical protein Cgig2_033893 [Carnegiea gigantea]
MCIYQTTTPPFAGDFNARSSVADAGNSNVRDSNGRFSRVLSAVVVRAYRATPTPETPDCLLSPASRRLQLLTPANQFCQGEGEEEGEEDVRVENEMTAAFRESAETPEVTCMVADEGGGVVRSGHKDGRIRCWRMEMDQRRRRENGVRECLSWQAHQGPVLSMVMTSYGSENGNIKIWPWEAIAKSLSLKAEERHMTSLIVERSYVDLKNSIWCRIIPQQTSGVRDINHLHCGYLKKNL